MILGNDVVIGFDATHENAHLLPANAAIVAGYSSGSPSVMWTIPDWNAHPGALRIYQDAPVSEMQTVEAERTSDYLDVENGAATPADAPVWAAAAWDAWHKAERPGQRTPAIYASASNITNVVNALIAGGFRDNVGLIVANWDLTQAQAVTEVQDAAGPFPVHGVQFRNAGPFDIDIYSGAWLMDKSQPKPTPLAMLKNAEASLADSQGDLAEAITDISAVIKSLTG